MSSGATSSRSGWPFHESASRIRVGQPPYGSRWQRMRRQVFVVIRHEIALSLHLLLFVVGGFWWWARLNDDFNLWTTLDKDLLPGAFMVTIAASTVAFLLGQRDMRNAITELYAGTVASRHDVVLARMIGMVLTTWIHLTVLVAGMYATGLLSASWGRPDVRILLPVFLWPVFIMPLIVVLGEWSTRLTLPGIMWLVVATLAAWFVHVVTWNPFAGAIIESLAWPLPPPHTAPGPMEDSLEIGVAWWQWLLIGGAMLSAALLVLPRRLGATIDRYRIAASVFCGLLAIALVVSMPLGLRNGDGYAQREVTGELDACISRLLFTACTHPAYASLLDAIDDDIADALAPIVGTSIPPLRLDYVPVDRYGDYLSESAGPYSPSRFSGVVLLPVGRYGYQNEDRAQGQLINQMFTMAGWSTGDDSARRVVQAWWLLELGYTAETASPIANAIGEPWNDIPGYTPPDLSMYIDRFAALSLVQQRDWLESNWDALRAGELTLEDLP